MSSTNNCLVKAQPYLSTPIYRQLLDHARTLQEDTGAHERAALTQAAEAALADVEAKLQEVKRSTTRRSFLIGTAASLASAGAEADVTLGRAKPFDEKMVNARVSPEVEKILVGSGKGTTNIEGYKALRQAMDKIASSGPQELRPLAANISKLLPNDTLMLSVEAKDMNAHGAVELSPFVRMRLFDGPKKISQGLRYSTVMHESLHAAVAARYRALSSGLLRDNDARMGMSAPQASAAMEQFHGVWDEFRAAAKPALRTMNTDDGLGLSIEEAAGSPDEFFVRALTEPGLQAWMAKQEYEGKTLLQKFINWVKTSLLGFKKEGTAPSWLDAALLASDDLLKAMGGDPADFKRLRAAAAMSEKRESIKQSTARPVFYSQLQLALEQVPERLSTMAAPQWKLWLDANASKMGVKKEEIEWSGIKDYLTMRGKDKVSSQELADYVRENGVRVDEVVKGNSSATRAIDDARVKLDALGYTMLQFGHEGDEIAITRRSDGVRFLFDPDGDAFTAEGAAPDAEKKPEVLTGEAHNWAMVAQHVVDNDYDSDELGASDVRYSQYTLPGGSNYREVLLTLPQKDKHTAGDLLGKPDTLSQDEAGERLGYDFDSDVKAVLVYPNAGESYIEILEDGRYRVPTAQNQRTFATLDSAEQYLVREHGYPEKVVDTKGSYHSNHWDEPNIIAHIRMDDRTDADGKRVLFIEELQSDWAQEGRRNGFKPTPSQLGAMENGSPEAIAALAMGDFGSMNQTVDDGFGRPIQQTLTPDRGRNEIDVRVPPAPFVEKTEGWLSLALKRIVKLAADEGYERVAFVSGQQSADRYDLSKQISQVRYEDNSASGVGWAEMSGAPSHGRLMAWDLRGREVLNKFVQTPAKDLPEMIGKDAAEKLLNQPGRNERTAGGMFARVKDLTGLDLKVGGEGMRGFYDKIVPAALSKLLSKVGGEKPGIVELQIPSREPGSRAPGGAVVGPNVTPGENFDALGFDITPAMRDATEDGMPLFSTARAARDMDVGFGYKVADFLDSSKKVSWWDKTVGTPYHLAQKHKTFGRVYNAIQNFISDVSKYATRAADMAPSILPKLEDMKDLFKSPLSAADVQALGDPIFKGTLIYTRNAEGDPVEAEDVGSAGIVWTDKELKSMWNLDDRQIGLYREFRKATNKSIADLAVTNMVRYAGEDAEGVRGRVLAATTVQQASEILADHLAFLAASDSKKANTLQNAARAIKDMADEARGLMARGYAPLSRYGDFTVYAPGISEHGYFEMFETERDANRRARELRTEFPNEKISVGTMSKEASKLFKGITPETLALFGDALGLEESASDRESQVFQEYLRMAKSTRSAMKRLIHRKGVSGYSNDVGRVLAGFVYSNARQAGQNLHAGEMLKSANEVPEGDLKDHAIKLLEYAQAPQDEAQAMRGLVFAQFIGGNLASAIVNTTQSFTTTWPTLSQHFGIAKSGKAMADALGIIKNGAGADEDLAQAMERAAKDGITDPNETHQLQGQAQGRGSLKSGDGTVLGDQLAKLGNGIEKLKFVWGKAFGLAEVLNRKIAFVSAYKLAREKGEKNPYEFAKKIVNDSQFVMNKGANPVWARGPVGATLFQFKKFSVFYLENLARMWGSGPEGKKAFAFSLAIMFLMAGAGGFPFAEDLDDVIDGFMQRIMNKSFSSKQAKKEFFAKMLGDAGAEFVLSGLSGLPGAPIDISGRLGMGNLIPATGLLVKKQNYGRDVQELFGAAGASAGRALQGLDAASQGDIGGAIEGFIPVSVANALKAKDMIEMGQYRDQKGRKVIDTTVTEALLKGVGFQPASVKNIQDAASTQQELIGLNKARETEIADLWAKGRIERKPELVEDAKRQLKEWNAANPDSPLKLDSSQIDKRVKEANMSKAQRLEKTAPKEIRKSVKDALTRETEQ